MLYHAVIKKPLFCRFLKFTFYTTILFLNYFIASFYYRNILMVHHKLIKPASWDVVYILETKQDFKIRYDVGDTFA